MVRRILLIFGIGILSFQVEAQDIHFSQYYNTPILLNPAKSGEVDGCNCIKAGGIYRGQWSSVNSTFRTFSLFYSQTLPKGIRRKDRMGFAFAAYQDVAGDARFTTLSLLGSFAYHWNIYDNLTVSLGAQATYNQKDLNFQRLTWGVQWNGTSINPSTPSNELEKTKFPKYFDANAGVQARYKINPQTNAFVGAAFVHLLGPNESYLNQTTSISTVLPLRMDYYAGMSYQVDTKNELIPSVLVRMQGTALEYLIGGNIIHDLDNPAVENALHLGFHARAGKKLNEGQQIDAVMPYLGLQYNKWLFGLTYDINVSSLRKGSGGLGGAEISATYKACLPGPPLDVYVPCFRN